MSILVWLSGCKFKEIQASLNNEGRVGFENTRCFISIDQLFPQTSCRGSLQSYMAFNSKHLFVAHVCALAGAQLGLAPVMCWI